MDPFAIVHDAGALVLVGLWVGSALWVYTDSLARLERREYAPRLLFSALALPFAAPLLYAFLRPAERPCDRRMRELSRRLLEEELAGGERCLECRAPVRDEFLRCPTCAAELRRSCSGCGASLRLHWSACPHCELGVSSPPRGLSLVA